LILSALSDHLAAKGSVWPFTWIPGIVWFVLKTGLLFFMFAMVKAFVPRYRYDQLMRLGWKVLLPISLAMIVIVASVLQVIRGLR
jgi:NADH-quinone oxidoreductase subunit H